jgi:hypothetical protein
MSAAIKTDRPAVNRRAFLVASAASAVIWPDATLMAARTRL